MSWKRVLLSLLVITVIMVAVGCSAPKPEKTVEAFMDAITSANYAAASTYCISVDSAAMEVLSPEEEESERLATAIFSRLTYKLGDTSVSGDEAAVSLAVTAPSMAPITATVMGEMFAVALAMAFSEDASEEMLNEMWIAKFQEKITAEDAPMVTNEITITLIKTNDGWLIQMDDALANALTGNMISAFAEMNDSE